MKTQKIFYFIVAAAAFLLCFFFLVRKKEEDPGNILEETSIPVEVEEEIWAYNKDMEKASDNGELSYDSVKQGDVLYNMWGYKLTVETVYENKIVLRQKGGFVPANKNGGFNAFDSAKETYELWKGTPLVLRSYSLDHGVLLTIRY